MLNQYETNAAIAADDAVEDEEYGSRRMQMMR
jgi:hypothetical protein